MIKRKGRFGEFLGCSGYSVKNEAGEPSCNTIINLDKQGNPMPPKVKIETTVACDKCGSPMILRDSKRGPFLGCSSFPKCRNTKMMKKLSGPDLAQVEALIPMLKEGAEKNAAMIAKILGENPAAAGAKPTNVATDIDCDECGKPMIVRTGRRGQFLGCSGYPKCKNTSELPARLVEELGLNANGNGAASGNGEHAKSEIETDISVD
jgi:DNA topoisomerase-1